MLQKVTMGFLNQLFRPTYHFNLQLPFYSTTAGLVEVAIGSWLFFLPPPRVSNACYRTRSYRGVWCYLMCTLSVSKLPDANSGNLFNIELLKKINPSYHS